MIGKIILAVLAALAAPQAAPVLEPAGEVRWSEGHKHFGGLSALVMEPDGSRLIAISDRATWIGGALTRENGALTGIEMDGIGRLRDGQARSLRGNWRDSEGVTLGPDGQYYISFEGEHRISRYATPDGAEETIEVPPLFERLQRNSGIEALASDARGTLYAIPERSGKWTRPFPVYRLRGGVWDKKLRIPRRGAYLVVGADIGPDGRLYVLERAFYEWKGGFATRLRRFRVSEDALDQEVTLLDTGRGQIENFEGISTWRDADGDIRITLISDDNFLPIQRTMLREFVLREAPVRPRGRTASPAPAPDPAN